MHIETLGTSKTTTKVTLSSLEEKMKENATENLFEQLDLFPKCDVIGIGAYPHIGITDIRSDGSSKTDLWQQFSINQINDELAQEIKNKNQISVEKTNTTAVSTFQEV